jgi:hypothetical protein
MTILDLDVVEYPPPSKLARVGQSMCAELIADRQEADALVLVPGWQSEDQLQGGVLHGGCWIHLNKGLLPAA